MNNYTLLLLVLFFGVAFNKAVAQNQVEIPDYLEKKIGTTVEYSKITTDSTAKKFGGLDSLINNSVKIKWETILKTDEDNIIANRVFKRMQIAYLNQSSYFFDSDLPVKFVGFLSTFNEISTGLVNKIFTETVPTSKEGKIDSSYFIKKIHLYKISPYDTLNYFSSLFFLEKLPLIFKENGKWGDTLITQSAVLSNSFTIKSVSEGNLNLYFKTSVVALNRKNDNQNNASDTKVRINVFENSTITEGYMNIDPKTLFIYSIEATITKKMESNINDSHQKSATVISKYSLRNAVE